MKNKKINIKTISLIVLIGLVISLIFIILNTKNKNIIQQEFIKEQLGETSDNTYVDIQTHLSEVNDKEQKLISFKSTIANAITDMGVETSEDADASTMVDNIRNLLSAKSNITKYHLSSSTLGPYLGVYTYNFDIKSVYDGDYTKLTMDNFITYALCVWSYDGDSISNTMKFNYNATTGILTASMSSSDRCNYVAHVWLIY